MEEVRGAVFSLDPDSSPVSHLVFVDDLVVFTRGNRGSIRNLFAVFGDFATASSQKANLQKIISRFAQQQQVRWITQFTRVSRATPPMRMADEIVHCRGKYYSDQTWEHRRHWRSWSGVALSVEQNGLGFRDFSLTASANALVRRWLVKVDAFMRARTRVIIHDGSCSLLYDNWGAQGSLVDFFDLGDVEDLRYLSV
ncbi:hypothetical protein K2173_004462 [Erythroxylum novogranatense]|uniref:Reverse transcriptase n=1 Tax=Erythroxylum novogranatense TaxID=1862640 RepID=A0AAV8T5N6_9ROSI|nr:hypothetical protein K2173_004462 [Erythroxylum novogranatense]